MKPSQRPGKVSLGTLLAWVIASALLIWIVAMIRRHNSSWDRAERFAALASMRRAEGRRWSEAVRPGGPPVLAGSASRGNANDGSDWRGNRERCYREADEFDRLEGLYRDAALRPWATAPREGPLR